MKVSYGIFLVGIILSIVLGMMVFSDLGNSDHLMYGLVSDDVFDKIITLYFFIVIIKFFFGGIIYIFERGIYSYDKIPLSEAEFDLEKTDLEHNDIKFVKNRSSRSNPTM